MLETVFYRLHVVLRAGLLENEALVGRLPAEARAVALADEGLAGLREPRSDGDQVGHDAAGEDDLVSLGRHFELLL